MNAARFRASLALLLLASVAPVAPLRAQGTPMFTSDYYLTEPAKWVDKMVTLSVTHLSMGESAEGANRRMEAHTFYNGTTGGKMDVVAPEAVAVRLIRQCGTTKQSLGKKQYRLVQIHGLLKREASGKGGNYYVLVEK